MLRLVVLLLLLLLAPVAASAQSTNTVTTSSVEGGPVIEFRDGDYILSEGLAVPTQGWTRTASPHIYRMHETGWRTGDYHTVQGRFRFDRSALGAEPLALYTVSTRNQFIVFVNGAEVFRNFARVSDQKLAWYRPFLVPLPAGALKPGINEIVIRAVSEESTGVGRVVIGPNAAVQDFYQSQYFWQITAPMAANAAMLALGGLAVLLWAGRRQEVELLWLALAAGLWFLRNYQYFAEVTPFDMALFNALTVYATYFATVATCAFYITFLKLPRREAFIAVLFALGVPIVIAHATLSLSNLILYAPSTIIGLGGAVLGFLDLRRHRSTGHVILALVVLLMPLVGIYDFLLAGGGSGWNTSGVYLTVFSGCIYCVAFLISFGKRALDAFSGLEAANVTLERRIAETRAELAASEASRRDLVVAGAIASERERLMQEMHDGIGSNLITALAVARQQKQPSSTIKTLSRALADLKITVDSLEPVEGDLIALIGNLRHRMAGDLREAGIACKWEVGECGALPWLDATNALHVLRIFQEAIGNVLTHSGGTEMRIGCHEEARDGVAGITAYVADNGRGFDATGSERPGKGLGNIAGRAKALHGVLECRSSVDEGTVVSLWLPYERVVAARDQL